MADRGQDILEISKVVIPTIGVLVAAFALIVNFPIYDFSLALSKTADTTVEPGSVVKNTITIDNNRLLPKYTGIYKYDFPVNLNISGQPAGILIAIMPGEEQKPPHSFTMNIGVMPNVTANKYKLVIEAIGGDGTRRSCTYYLTILDRKNRDNKSKASDWGYVGGDLMNKENRYEDALKWFDNAISLDGTNPNYWRGKAGCSVGLARYNDTLNYANKSLYLNHKEGSGWIDNDSAEWAWENKGVALCNLMEYKEAINCFNNSIELNSKNEWAWFWKGITYEKMENYQAALICFNETTPENVAAWYGKGRAFKALHYDTEAGKAFAKARELGG